MSLAEAIDCAMSGFWGTVLCCVPGKLAFYKEEDIGDAFILERKQ
jgi:hypothetical protein